MKHPEASERSERPCPRVNYETSAVKIVERGSEETGPVPEEGGQSI